MRGRGCPPQERLDPQEQLLASEGLHDVVVGARAEAAHLVDLAAAHGEQDHGHVTEVADALERLEAVELGHREVEDDEVARARVEGTQRHTAVLRRLHGVAGPAKEFVEQKADVVVVVDDEHPPQGCRRHWGSVSATLRPMLSPMKAFAAVTVVVVALLAGSSARALRLPAAPHCPVFPANNAWNQRVDRLPVAADSAQLVASIGLDSPVHADFGSGTWD